MKVQATTAHIALFLPSLEGGGAERAVLNLGRGLIARGHRVDMVLTKAAGPYLLEVPSSMRLFDLNQSRVLHSVMPLARYLKLRKPDAMLSTLGHCNVAALWAKHIARSPVRVVFREATTPSEVKNSTQSSYISGFSKRFFYRMPDAVVAVSQGVRQDLIKALQLPEDLVHCIYNPSITDDLYERASEAIDHSWFQDDAPAVILAVGRLIADKDYATLLRAFQRVSKSNDVRLMILGEGPERAALEALSRSLQIEDRVCLMGHVNNPFKYMARASVFVLSSKREGLPNALIQAMALGAPLVATDCRSGPREILEDGRWGSLVPVGDVEPMADAIVAALQNARPMIPPEHLERFSQEFSTRDYEKVLLVEHMHR